MELKENAVNALVWGPGNMYIPTVCMFKDCNYG